ncbi:MAG TPA: hypothetical protein DCZ94_16440 [Lentisphaeria bacterium]|nr:hypothetical protein [Lentisphaeria bacterium]
MDEWDLKFKKNPGSFVMNVFQAIRRRYSARAYTTKKADGGKLRKILESARLAPSASNRQEWRFIVMRRGRTRKLLAEAASISPLLRRHRLYSFAVQRLMGA